MTSETAFRNFLKALLKEEKIRLSKEQMEELFDDTYVGTFDEIVFRSEEVQKDFVC